MSHKADSEKERLLVCGYIRNLKSLVISDHSSISTFLIQALCKKFYQSCTDNCTFAQKELSKLYESNNDAWKIWAIKKYIVNCVSNIEQNQQCHRNDCTLLVTSLIHIHSNISQIVASKFGNQRKFKLAIFQQFQSLINVHTLQMFAFYIHINVKQRGNLYGNCVLNNVNNTLNELFNLYKYTIPKYNPNPFDIYYQIYLENRLLKNISNIQTENMLIQKYISHFIGFTATQKLLRMLHDKIYSIDMMKKFKQFDNMKQFGHSLNYELQVNVCAPEIWTQEAFDTSEIKTPNEIAMGMDKFSFFYQANRSHNGKQLEFQLAKGDAIIEIDFNPKTRKKLIVSTLQMIVLLCFNEQNICTAKEILNCTNIEKSELAKVIRGLCHPKVAILNKKPNVADIKDNHIICLNENYKNASQIIAVPALQQENKLKYKTIMVDNQRLEWIM